MIASAIVEMCVSVTLSSGATTGAVWVNMPAVSLDFRVLTSPTTNSRNDLTVALRSSAVRLSITIRVGLRRSISRRSWTSRSSRPIRSGYWARMVSRPSPTDGSRSIPHDRAVRMSCPELSSSDT